MNWISNVVRPRIRSFLSTKREVPDNLWVQCPESGQMVFHKDLEANAFVVPGSNYHMRMGGLDRLAYTFDGGTYEPVPLPTVPVDPLKFRDGRRYTERLKDAKSKAGVEDAVVVGEGTIEGSRAVIAVQDFRFMGGSLGMAAGEAVITGMERAVASDAPFVLFAASGGARMQEGILSLMQMPRTTIAVQRLRDAGLPYIVVLTDPTTGGVTASYAMLGDIHIAEPGALICFAGPRVIEQTIREQLPDGFQRAEYLLEHGMIDMVVHRHQMRETLGRLCRVLAPGAGTDAGSFDAQTAAVAPEVKPKVPPSVDMPDGAEPSADASDTTLAAAADPEVKQPATAIEASAEKKDANLTVSAAEKPAAKSEASMLGDLNILSTLGFASAKTASPPDAADTDADAHKHASTPGKADGDEADMAEAKSEKIQPDPNIKTATSAKSATTIAPANADEAKAKSGNKKGSSAADTTSSGKPSGT